MAQQIAVLLVDDEPQLLRALQRMLTRRGFAVDAAGTAEAALERLARTPADVIISDFRMPGMNGAELLAEVAARFPATRRILLSGCAELTVNVDAVFVPKPYDDARILELCSQGKLG